MWTAVQDGSVITEKMTEDQVWSRCQLFGAPPLVEALEQFIEFGELDYRCSRIANGGSSVHI